MARNSHVIVDLSARRTAAFSSRRRCVGPVLERCRAVLRRWRVRHRQRRALGDLDEHLLRDIGLTPAEVTHELAKRFWHP